MKNTLVVIAALLTFSAQAKVFCKGEVLEIETIISQNVDVLNELYNGDSYSDYDGVVCGVEDADEICFRGRDIKAAKALTKYFRHAYEYDDGMSGFFVKFANGDFNSVDLIYKEQGSSNVHTIQKCKAL